MLILAAPTIVALIFAFFLCLNAINPWAKENW